MRKHLIIFLVLIVILAAGVGALPDDYRQFQEVEELFANQNYIEANQQFGYFLVEYPDSEYVPLASYHKAISLYKIDFVETALERFTFIEKRYRNASFAPAVSYWKGLCGFTLGDYRNAVTEFEEYRQKTIESQYTEESFFYTIRAHARMRQYQEAEQVLTRFLEEQPQSDLGIKAALHYADILLQNGESGQVISFTDWVIPEHFSEPADTDQIEQLTLYRAEAFRLTESIEKAKSLYERLKQGTSYISLIAYNRLYFIALQQEESDLMETLLLEVEGKFSGQPELLMGFWLQAGMESFERGEVDLSEYFLNRVWSIRDKTAVPQEAALTLAEIYIQSEDRAKAKQMLLDFRDYAGTPPPQIYVKLGNLYFVEQDYEKAVRQFRNAIEQTASNSAEEEAKEQAYYHGASALRSLGKYDEALALADTGLSEYPEGSYTRELKNVKIGVLWESNRFPEAEQVLSSYLDRYPDDARRWVDLEKIFAIQKKYSRILSIQSDIERDFPGLERVSPQLFYTHSFLTGVAAYEEGDYSLSAAAFESVPDSFKAGYYYGYSLYRIEQYSEAVSVLSSFSDMYPDHAFSPQAVYTAGLAAMELGSFEDAARYFRKVETEEDQLNLKARFNLGLCQKKQNQYREAAAVFNDLADQEKSPEIAELSQLQYAEVLGLEGNIDEAAVTYREFPEKFTKSPLRDDALINLALLYHNSGRYERAKDVCAEYERLFPRGNFIDAALYYAADSAVKSDSPTEGLLLWEKLIDQYPESRYRKAALQNSGKVYGERGNYREALEQYELLVQDYPNLENRTEIEKRITALRYQLAGDTERIAELKSTITHAERSQTKTGRQAMLELADMYIFDVQAPDVEGHMEEAYSLLTEVAGSGHPEDAAEAQYLLGEYYAKKKDYDRSLESFLNAADIPEAADTTKAKSLYRGAETANTIGRDNLVRELISRLEQEHPSSRWTEEARAIIEG